MKRLFSEYFMTKNPEFMKRLDDILYNYTMVDDGGWFRDDERAPRSFEEMSIKHKVPLETIIGIAEELYEWYDLPSDYFALMEK